MNTIFRPDSSFLFTGLLWIYIFLSLSFFDNHKIVSKEFSQVQAISLHNNVLFTSEYQDATEAAYIYVQNANNHLTLDSDELSGVPLSVHSAAYHLIKVITSCSHLHSKNSPITIRMTSSVLLV